MAAPPSARSLVTVAITAVPTPRSPDRHPSGALRVPNFRLYLAGQAVSQTGTWLQLVALGWLGFELTGSGTALGWVVAAIFGPLLLLGPWTGALADRVDKHRLLTLTQLLAAIPAAALGLLVLTGSMTTPLLYGTALACGLRYAWRVPELRTALALTAVVATFGFNHQVLVPLLAHHTFAGGAGTYILLYSAMSVGSVLGAIVAARRPVVDVRFLGRATVGFGVATGLVALAPSLPLAVAAGAASGGAGLLFVAASIALLQQRSDPAMRGRVMALAAMVIVGGLPIGGPIVGWVAELTGPRGGLALGAVTALVAGAAVLSRTHPSHHPGSTSCPASTYPASTPPCRSISPVRRSPRDATPPSTPSEPTAWYAACSTGAGPTTRPR